MKRLSCWMALLLVMLAAVLPAQADMTSEILENFGLTQTEADAFAALVEEKGTALTATDILTLLGSFPDEDMAPEGTLLGNVYTDPNGVTVQVPEGWHVLEERMGMTVMLMGPADETTGFAPTIGVLVLDEPNPEFDTADQTYWDSFYGLFLENYRCVSFEESTYQDTTAHTLTLTYGQPQEAGILQRQMYFNKNDRAYVITLTALAKEEAQADALEVFEEFLAGFLPYEELGQG